MEYQEEKEITEAFLRDSHPSKQYNEVHPYWNYYKITIMCLRISKSVLSGAYEPLKAAKEHETYASCQVPSQSKFIGHYYQLVSI